MGGPDWDARYRGAEGGLFGEAPSPWLRMCLARGVQGRTALCLADGDGRNGTWLAARGWAVTGLDLSVEATRRAQARDRAAGTMAERVAADLTDWSPEGRVWDLCTLIYLQGPPDLRRRGLEAAAAATAPGGWLLVEGFGGAAGDGPGPGAAPLRWSTAETLGWLDPEWEAVEAMEGAALLDEGPKHQGRAQVMRLLLRRA